MHNQFIQFLESLTGSDSQNYVACGNCRALATRDPNLLVKGIAQALSHDAPVALIDPDWTNPIRKQAFRILEAANLPDTPGILLIPSSGSSGNLKFCVHSLDTLLSAAHAYAEKFSHANTIIALPLFHIGGLMALFRAYVLNNEVFFLHYRSLQNLPASIAGDSTISLVPTQISRLVNDGKSRKALKAFRYIIAGGAAFPADLHALCRDIPLRIVLSYGMTETAAMVSSLPVDAFLAGELNCGYPLPHAAISIDAGEIIISSNSNCLGKIPHDPQFNHEQFRTRDEGYFNENGTLTVCGRLDRIINSGGKKVNPGIVENALNRLPGIEECAVFSEEDPDWGQRVEAAIVINQREPFDPRVFEAGLREILPSYMIPKKFYRINKIPKTTLHKTDLLRLKHILNSSP